MKQFFLVPLTAWITGAMAPTALAETTIMPTIRAMAITRLRVRLRFLIWISSF